MSDKLIGDRYSIDMGKGSKAEKPPENLPKGVVSGETSGEVPDVQAKQEYRFEALKRLEDSVRADAMLFALFEKIDDANPLHRIERLLETLGDMRRGLEASDSHPNLKKLRGNLLSKLMNQLRGLL